MPIAPTLILGLGGTGSKIIEKVSEKVRESGSSQGERIAFVVFDTDINDLERIHRKSPEIYTVQTSTRNTVGEYLNINTNARDNWFPVNEMLNRKTLTEGAAQVRAISRLAFDTTLKAGNLKELHEAIEQLFRIDKDQQEQSLRVIITSSLAGGTGSGLILSVAMYLANYLRTKYPKAKAITRGFFVQPDVFYKVIHAAEEQQNLQVNAYAAIRELDAFLMKGDNTLPQRYADLAFEFPRVGSSGVEEVKAMPYDFCFLFDSNNATGGSLDSFESYLDHAATCIYTQSIGPMSKKSNSREDNVLREVIKNDGRNRYAGAGASRLVYPWMHLRDVVAYNWANEALSSQWLQFDQQFKEQQKALAEQRANGIMGRDINRGENFVAAIDEASSSGEGFAKAVRNQCLRFDEDGLEVVSYSWDEYVKNLLSHVERTGEVASEQSMRSHTQSRISELTTEVEASSYVEVYQDLKKYKATVSNAAEQRAGMVGYTLFKSRGGNVTKDGHSHQLETYLRNSNGEFVHPVSARYFLYQTIALLKQQKMQTDRELSETKDFLDSFERNAFDDPNTEEVEGTDEFGMSKTKLLEKLTKRPSAHKQELVEQFTNYLRKVDDLRKHTANQSVLAEAMKYVDGIAKSFEILFTALESNLRNLRGRVQQEKTKYDDLKGSTTRYVLASSEVIDGIYKTMPYTGGVMNVDTNLAEGIYSKVREYYMLTDEKDENFFKDLFERTMLQHFKDEVMEFYGPEIKIDIIEALEREYRLTTKNYEEANVKHYVTEEIQKAKKLAAPFLEQPLGEERHPIQACAYNPAIEGDADPRRKALIDENFGNYGGERDDEISPQEVLFYNAIYGIRARDLSKYSAERNFVTDKRPAGDYFSAYYELVSEIKPSVLETKVITPHVDRRWHSISMLPDLDEDHQAALEREIHNALLAGLVHDKIVLSPTSNGEKVYRYVPDGALEHDFIVSNGTPCDQFYEVVDALTINPVAVKQILSAVERMVSGARDGARSVSFKDTFLAEVLVNGIPLPELRQELPDFEGRIITVFDVAAFYSISTPREQFSDGEVFTMVENFLGFLREDIAGVSDAGDTVDTLETYLRQQFETFRDNSSVFVAAEGISFNRKLRTILRPLAVLADELQLRGFLKEINAFDVELRDQV